MQQAISEAHHSGRTLYVAYLDAKPAFDAVYVKSLLRKLYLQGVEGPLWDMFAAIHTAATSRVKWGGYLSEKFDILQGVRQGGLTSTMEYKHFIDPLLWTLQGTGVGASFGETDLAAPTCADDVALMAFEPENLQVLLHLAHSYSQQEGYRLQPKKCAVVMYGHPTKHQYPFTIGTDPIPVLESTKHIGIERDSVSGGVTGHTAAVISKANRAFFAKMRPNLAPVTATDIFQTAVLPVLTYGMETLVFTDDALEPIESAQEFMLQQILGLPSKTPKYVTNLLLGLLPAKAIIHKRILGFFRSLITPGTISRSIIERDLAICGIMDKYSWSSMVSRVLAFYDLPSAFSLLQYPPTATVWKDKVTKAINAHWEHLITALTATYPSLRFVQTSSFRIGRAHHAVTSVLSNPIDTVKVKIRLKLLTGTYILQSNRPSFNQHNSRMCPLCRNGVETRQHFILECEVLNDARREKLAAFGDILYETFKVPFETLPLEKQFQYIMDPSSLLQGDTNPDLAELETAARRLCHQLHVNRYRLQGLVPRRKRKPKPKRKPAAVQGSTAETNLRPSAGC